jgi:ADP-ribosylglycohydrolase
MPLDFRALADRYIAWADSRPKDIGVTTRQALAKSSGFEESSQRAADLYSLTKKRSGGNGTIMRASPLAFLPLDGPEFRQTVAVEAAITHGSPEAAEASILQVSFIRQLLQTGEISLREFGNYEFSDKILEVFEEYENDEYLESEIRIGGTAWVSLAIAMASLRFDSYEEGVRWAISLGYDTDTNTSCAGVLLAARDGFESIPEEWLGPLEEKDRIDRAIEGLAAVNSA